MKNIAIISISLNAGGVQRAAGLVSKYLSEIYNVYLFLLDTEDIVYEYGGQIVDIGKEGADYAEYYVDLYKKYYNIDCCISFWEIFNIWNVRTKGREKVIISERDAVTQHIVPHYNHLYQMKKLYCKADEVVIVAEGIRKGLVELCNVANKNISTIYNFINQERIKKQANLEMEYDISNFIKNSKVFVNVGRLETQKNQKRLIKQFAQLSKERKDVKLLIIGSGQLKEELDDLIIQLEQKDSIKILPFCHNPFPYLRIADVFVLSSHHEGLPNSLFEAICMGIPSVAVDCLSGPRELLDSNVDYSNKVERFQLCKRGILVTDSISEDECKTYYLKEAMAYMLDHEEYLIMVKENQKSFMNKYNNESIIEQWVRVIEADKESIGQEYNISEIDVSKKVVIYGAGKFGRIALKQLQRQNIDVMAFVVSNVNENSSKIMDIPVYCIDDMIDYKDEICVVMGVSMYYQNQIVKKLTDLDFKDIYFMRFEPEKD